MNIRYKDWADRRNGGPKRGAFRDWGARKAKRA